MPHLLFFLTNSLSTPHPRMTFKVFGHKIRQSANSLISEYFISMFFFKVKKRDSSLNRQSFFKSHKKFRFIAHFSSKIDQLL